MFELTEVRREFADGRVDQAVAAQDVQQLLVDMGLHQAVPAQQQLPEVPAPVAPPPVPHVLPSPVLLGEDMGLAANQANSSYMALLQQPVAAGAGMPIMAQPMWASTGVWGEHPRPAAMQGVPVLTQPQQAAPQRQHTSAVPQQQASAGQQQQQVPMQDAIAGLQGAQWATEDAVDVVAGSVDELSTTVAGHTTQLQ